MSDPSDADPDPGFDWTRLGRLNDVLSLVFFPLALFSGLTGVGLLAYVGGFRDHTAVPSADKPIEVAVPPRDKDMVGPAAPAIRPKADILPPSSEIFAPPVRQPSWADPTKPPAENTFSPVPTVAKGGEEEAGGSDSIHRSSESGGPAASPKFKPNEGWIYAGAYATSSFYSGPYYSGPCRYTRCQTGWTSRYLDFSDTASPDALAGQELLNLSSSNIRTDRPSTDGKLANTVGIVPPRTRLVVKKVYVKPQGQEVWLKVAIYGSLLPLNVAGRQ